MSRKTLDSFNRLNLICAIHFHIYYILAVIQFHWPFSHSSVSEKFTNNLLGMRVMRQNGKNIQFIAKSCSILNRTQVSWRSGVGIFWGVFVENVINTSDASLSKPYQFHIFWHRGILGTTQSLGVTQSNSDSFNSVWILFWFDFLFYLRFFDDDHYCCIEVWNVFAIIIIVWFNVSVPIERIWMVRVCFEFVVCIKCFVFSLKCTCSECFFLFSCI